MFPFLVRFCSLQWTGSVLVGLVWFDVINVMASKKKKKKIQLTAAICGSQTSELKLPITGGGQLHQ